MSMRPMQRLVPSQLLDSKSVSAEKQQFSLHSQYSANRKQLESYIIEKYQRIHNASITEFMPILLQMSKEQAPQAILGLRPGYYKHMFLEQYLNSPIEQHVASLSKQPVDRSTLIEVGNLAVTHRGAGMLLFVILALALAKAGYEWMVFTVTDEVERLMHRLGFTPLYLISVDPRLPNSDWGSYYNNNPRVMVGNLTEAVSIVKSHTFLTLVSEGYYQDITAIASSMSSYLRSADR